MIEYDVPQGSPEWLKARLGIVSASRFKDVLTQPRSKKNQETGVLSDTASTYMMELISEILTCEQKEISGKALEWGAEHEPIAVNRYDMLYADVRHTGIILHDNLKIGASPDGLIGDYGMIEIKCPFVTANHIKAIVNDSMPDEHIPQVQGNMWINGRQWCDFISFDPRIPGDKKMFIKRIQRDDEYIAMLSQRVMAFVNKLDSVLLDKFGIAWEGVTINQEA